MRRGPLTAMLLHALLPALHPALLHALLPAILPAILPALAAAVTTPAVAAEPADWPHWRGPGRNDVVAEDSGWDRGAWPLQKPEWSTEVGAGATSPLVVDGRLYTMGNDDGRDTVWCLDAATGKTLWKTSYPCARYGRFAAGDEGLYAGVTSTPEFDPQTGYLYTLSADGDLSCWDTKTAGRRVWRRNLYDDHGMRQRAKIGRSPKRDYGYTSSPLLDADSLIVEVGSPQGNLMGFEKHSGRRLWASESTDQAGHTAGPVPITVQGVPCVAVLTLHHLLVARLDSRNRGKTVAEHPWATEFANNIASPAVEGSSVLITSGYNHRSMCKLQITLRGASAEWEQPYYSKVCTPIIHGGRVFWAWRKLTCLDFRTGRLMWSGQQNTGDAGSCILTGDGRLIAWSGRGDLSLVQLPSRPDGSPRQLARTAVPCRDDVWPHVVLAGGRLYCKDRWGVLCCFRLTAGRAADPHVPLAGAGTKPSEPVPETPRSEPREGDAPASGSAAGIKTWPGKDPALVLAWQRGFGPGKILGPSGELAAKWRFERRGEARFGTHRQMELADGAMLVHGADRTVLDACKKTDQLSIETMLVTARVPQSGPARIISFSTDPYHRNFTLGQESDRLLFRLRTSQTGPNGMNPQAELCRITAGRPCHVIVSYRPGLVVCYLDGRTVCRSDAVEGDFSNWTTQHLLFGDEWQDSRDWDGSLERVAIFSRFIGQDEAQKRYATARPMLPKK